MYMQVGSYLYMHVKVTHIAASPPLLKGTAGGEISMGFVLVVGIAEETGNGAAVFKSLHQGKREEDRKVFLRQWSEPPTLYSLTHSLTFS